MTKYIELRWHRNKEPNTLKYVIYRSASLPITKESQKIAEVLHVEQETPVRIEEIVHLIDYNKYKLSNKNIMNLSLEVMSTDEMITDDMIKTIEVDEEEGSFKVEEPELSFKVSYFIDAVSYIDKDSEGTRFAPALIDTNSIQEPKDIRLSTNSVEGILKMKIRKPISEGKVAYYAIESIGKNKAESILSEPIRAKVQEEIIAYELEESLDKKEWKLIASFSEDEYSVTAAIEPPRMVADLVAIRIDNGVELKWNLRKQNKIISHTPFYRLRSKSSNNKKSVYTEVIDSVSIGCAFKKITIIKEGAGKKETIEVSLEESEVSSYIDITGDTSEVRYTVYIEDRAGNRSLGNVVELKAKGSVTNEQR